MTLLWPWALAGLVLVPLLFWLYQRNQQAKSESVVLHPDFALLRQAAGRRTWQRWVPLGLYGLALALGVFAVARPTLPVLQADPKAGIVLAVDISRSMAATDVSPNRFEAARAALRTFIKELPSGARVALVTFSRNATTVVPLTTERHKLLEAVELLELDFGTAIGDAIYESLTALPSIEEREGVADPKSLATIILLTDGRSVVGSDPIAAALEAQDQQVRIHAIGIGRITEGPVPGLPEQYAMAAQFDEQALREIADITEGQYVYVSSAQRLKAAYRDLTQQMIWRVKRDEASALFALGAGLVLLVSLLVSQWRRRVI